MSKCEKCLRKLNDTCRGNSEVEIQCSAVDFRYFKPITNNEIINRMTVEEKARILFSLPHDEISKVKTSNSPGIDLLDVVNWLNSECEVVE